MLLRQSALYLVANALAAVIGFASVVLLTRLVTPSEYGIYVLVMSLGAVISTCLFTWQRHAALRFQSEPQADVRLSLLTGYIATAALHPLALLVLVYAISIPWPKALAAVLLAAALSFYELGQEILRARQLVSAYVRGIIVRSVASLGLCLAAVASDTGGFGLIAAVCVAYLASALASAGRIWGGPRAPANQDVLRQLARYGVPITISGLFVALSLALDRYVIYALLGTEAVGLYGATADFVRQCAIIPALSASLAIAPLAVASHGQDDGAAVKRDLGDGLELLVAALLPAVVGLSIAAPQIAGTVLGLAYRDAATALIPLVAFAFFAHSLSQQYIQLSFGLAQRPRYYILHTGSIFLLNAALIVPLVTVWGAWGAAVSLLVSEVFGVAFGLLLTRFTHPLPLIPARLLRIIIATAVMGVVCAATQQLVERTDLLGLLALIAAGAVSFGTAALLLDIARLRSTAASLLSERRRVARTLRTEP